MKSIKHNRPLVTAATLFLLAIYAMPSRVVSAFPAPSPLADDDLQVNCDKLCEKRPTDEERKKHYVVIDANTGARLAGGDEFPNGAEVLVFIVNKNPFKYSYTIKIKT